VGIGAKRIYLARMNNTRAGTTKIRAAVTISRVSLMPEEEGEEREVEEKSMICMVV